MKEHKIRELVNELRDTALKYYNHQSLREHIANKIIPVLEELDQSKVLEHYRSMLEEQKLIIRALKGTCGDMGTTDMFTALIRKDAEIARLREDLAVLEDGLAADKALDAALREVDANTIASLQAHVDALQKFIYWECGVYLNGQNPEFSKKYKKLLDLAHKEQQ